jgi:NDP-sugar pyrophosphorylase family protein
MRIRKAMVLAAGEGTRLRPLTDTRAKPVIPVVDRPLIGHTLRLLARHGIEEVGINLHHLSDQVREVVGDGSPYGVSVEFSHERELLGTAGAVKKMESFFDEDFVVIYGDNFLNIDLVPLADLHAAARADAVIGLFHSSEPSACGIVELDADGRVTRFVEKPASGESESDAANAGVYVMSPHVLAAIPAGSFTDFGRDVFPSLLARGAAIYAEYVDGYLEDTGTFERYKKVCFDILGGKAGEGIAARVAHGIYVSDRARFDGADDRARGHVAISSGTVVEPGAIVTDSIIWEDCIVGSGAAIENSILAEHCAVGAGATVADTILGAGTIVGERASVADCVLAAGSRVAGGKQLTGLHKEH